MIPKTLMTHLWQIWISQTWCTFRTSTTFRMVRTLILTCIFIYVDMPHNFVNIMLHVLTNLKNYMLLFDVFTEKPHDGSMWTNMGPKYKAMFVSICVFVVIFLAFSGIYFAVGRRKNAVVSYYCANNKLTAEIPCYF